MSDVVFEPLTFRNLSVKNRIGRSSVAGRRDNCDRSGNRIRINFSSSFVSVFHPAACA